jgi:hypothetical protein
MSLPDKIDGAGDVRFFVLEDHPYRVEAFKAVLHDRDVTYAIAVDDAVFAFTPPYDVILLDHDLGGEELVDSNEPNTGYQFAKWLIEHQSRLKDTAIVIVHSWNPDGTNNIAWALKNAGWNVMIKPYGAPLLRLLPSIQRATT